MLSFAPPSSSAISELPDYLRNLLSATFTGVVTYEATPFSPYQQLISGTSHLIYTMELDYRAVR